MLFKCRRTELERKIFVRTRTELQRKILKFVYKVNLVVMANEVLKEYEEGGDVG